MPSGDLTENSLAPAKPVGSIALLRPPFDSLLILACAALPYLQCLRFEFAYDDDRQVLANPGITSWHFVPAYFTQPIAGFFHGVASAPYYRPLFFVWFRLNYFLFGIHPVGWHLTNILLHATASLLVFAVLRRYFKDHRWAAIGAMIFAAHPAHVESVAWVSGCTDSLMSVSLLASLLLWMQSRASHSAGRYALSFVFCGMAFFTKETAIVLPVLIFAHAYFPLPAENTSRRNGFLGALRAVFPYALIAIAYFGVRHVILRNVAPLPLGASPSQALLTIPSLIVFYGRHLIWPVNLGLYYDIPVVTSATSWRFWIPLVLLASAATAAAALFRRTRDTRIPLACLWLILPLAPVLYIAVFQTDDFAHDRYLYLSVIALSILVGWLCELATSLAASRQTVSWAPIVSGLLIFFFGILTAIETIPWRNNLVLYSNAVRVAPKHPLARNNFARELAQINHFEEAATILQGLLADRPNLWLANYNYGFVNYRLGRLPLAEEYLSRSIQIDPKEADQHLYLGATYLKQGHLPAAEAQLRMAIALNPQGQAYHYTLGVIDWQMGKLAAARDEMELELKYYPDTTVIRGQIETLNRELAKFPQ